MFKGMVKISEAIKLMEKCQVVSSREIVRGTVITLDEYFSRKEFLSLLKEYNEQTKAKSRQEEEKDNQKGDIS